MKYKNILIFLFVFSCSKKELPKTINFDIRLSHLGGVTRWKGKAEKKGDFYDLKVFHIVKKIMRNPVKMETLKVVEKKIPLKEIKFEFNLKNFKESKEIKRCFSGITDFYPTFYFEIENKQKIIIISKSNCKRFAPWNIKVNNKIYIDEQGIIYDFVKKILEYGEIPLRNEGLPTKK